MIEFHFPINADVIKKHSLDCHDGGRLRVRICDFLVITIDYMFVYILNHIRLYQILNTMMFIKLFCKEIFYKHAVMHDIIG